MKDSELIQTLRTASEIQDNFALKMLLIIAAQRLEELCTHTTTQ